MTTRHRLTVDLSEQEHRTLKIRAAEEGVSMTELVRGLIGGVAPEVLFKRAWRKLSRGEEPIGYLFCSTRFCPKCVIERMIEFADASPGARDMPVEQALDQIAQANAIDRGDEASFVDGEFPKVVFQDQLTEPDNSCQRCGKLIWPSRER